MRRVGAWAGRIEPAWPISLGLAATVFSAHWSAISVPFALDRVLLWGGIALAVGLAGARRDLPPLRLGGIHLLLLAVLCFATVSAFWVGTLDAHDSRFALIDQLGVIPFALFAVAPSAFATERQRGILLGVLVVLGLYLGLTALFESVKLNALVWPKYILDTQFGIHRHRARGPFVEAETMGVALTVCGVAAGVALARWRDRPARVLAWGVLGLCGAGVVLTYTRSVWVGAAAAVVITLAAFPVLRWRLVPVAALTAAGLVVAIALVPGLGSDLSSRFNDRAPINSRQTTNQAALHMIASRPVLGYGWGLFVPVSPDHVRTIVSIPYTAIGEPVHNVFLSRAAELGLVGAGLWLIALLLALGRSLVVAHRDDREPWRVGFCAVLATAVAGMLLAPFTPGWPWLALWLWAGVLWTPAVSPAGRRLLARPAPHGAAPPPAALPSGT
jgi:putative inorganic carbon (HCO3(-)) transporter